MLQDQCEEAAELDSCEQTAEFDLGSVCFEPAVGKLLKKQSIIETCQIKKKLKQYYFFPFRNISKFFFGDDGFDTKVKLSCLQFSWETSRWL